MSFSRSTASCSPGRPAADHGAPGAHVRPRVTAACCSCCLACGLLGLGRQHLRGRTPSRPRRAVRAAASAGARAAARGDGDVRIGGDDPMTLDHGGLLAGCCTPVPKRTISYDGRRAPQHDQGCRRATLDRLPRPCRRSSTTSSAATASCTAPKARCPTWANNPARPGSAGLEYEAGPRGGRQPGCRGRFGHGDTPTPCRRSSGCYAHARPPQADRPRPTAVGLAPPRHRAVVVGGVRNSDGPSDYPRLDQQQTGLDALYRQYQARRVGAARGGHPRALGQRCAPRSVEPTSPRQHARDTQRRRRTPHRARSRARPSV